VKGTFLRDNIEAFAVAIAMALVIRHFCIEAFRIPTGSMMPTLLGDRGSRGEQRHGDRILVDKYVWLWRKPHRFEVAVFQYPLNRNKNFIKRIGGLPGEWLRVVDGDVWTSTDKGTTWRIARKPDGVQDQLFFPYYPRPVGDPEFFDGQECWKGGERWRVDEPQRLFVVDAGEEPAPLTFIREVGSYPDIDSDPVVGDVKVSFELTVRRAGELAVHIEEHTRPYRLVLSSHGSYFEINGDRKPLEFRLEDGMNVDVSFANVDDRLVVSLDGATQKFDYTTNKPPDVHFDGWQRHTIRLEAIGMKADIEDLSIARDIHYQPGSRGGSEPWKIPADHYFMLGDNTQHSKDSREWEINEAYLKNGEVIRWEYDNRERRPNPPGGDPGLGSDHEVVVFSDIDGHLRRFVAGDVKEWTEGVGWASVSRDHLVGRAFSVFWPIYLPPISKNPTRVKLIR